MKTDLPLLSIRDLVVNYPVSNRGRNFLTAVNGVSFDIHAGSIFGLVGESGSGKSSLAHTIMRLIPPTGGEVLFKGENLAQMKGPILQKARQKIQLVFQDPMASLSPRRSILQTLIEPLDHFHVDKAVQRQTRAVRALESVGLEAEVLQRFPHELSGGQKQRVALARALITEPELIIADEALSSLDVSVQARIIQLILDLRQKQGIAFLFISHDLAVIQQLADSVGVMYLGKMMEIAPAERLFQQAAHPYTRSLLDAVPVPDPAHRKPLALKGDAPSSLTPPAACVFHTRCPRAEEQCSHIEPIKRQIGEAGMKNTAHNVWCHLWNE